MAESDYKRILARYAKRYLDPLGGSKRGANMWLLDRQYWIVLVEFQPHKWEKGAFLNVGAHWLWSHQGQLGYSYSRNRSARVINDVAPFENAEQYKGVAENMATRAAHEVEALCEDCGTIGKIANLLAGRASSWPLSPTYDAGIAAGLAGDVNSARVLFASMPEGYEILARKAQELSALLETPEAFVELMRDRVEAARTSLKLPTRPITFGL